MNRCSDGEKCGCSANVGALAYLIVSKGLVEEADKETSVLCVIECDMWGFVVC